MCLVRTGPLTWTFACQEVLDIDGNLVKAKELQIFLGSTFKICVEVGIFQTQSAVNATKSIHMPKNACLEITSGNFEKSLPTSLFVEKVSMTILELTY